MKGLGRICKSISPLELNSIPQSNSQINAMPGPRNSAVNQTGTPRSVSDRSPSPFINTLLAVRKRRRRRRRRPFGSGRFAESCVPAAFEKPHGTWEGKRKSERTSPALVTTRRTLEAPPPTLTVLQPLKFGFHCFAAGTFIDFRRRTVMDAAFIVIVERTPLSFSLSLRLLPLSFPPYLCSKKFHPSTELKFDFHRETFETSGHEDVVFRIFGLQPLCVNELRRTKFQLFSR